MTIDRRTFLKSIPAISAIPLLASGAPGGSAAGMQREFYELRCYRMHPGTRLTAAVNPERLHGYLSRAFLPALKRHGVGPVGVFTEITVDKATGSSAPLVPSPVWMLTPFSSMEAFVRASTETIQDPEVQRAGQEYLHAPKSSPAFERVDSWFLIAFPGHPRLRLPSFSRERVVTRVFEMRDYESHSEERALNKIAMFDDGETEVMQDLGMSPVFYGQALTGPDLPHMRYMTSGPDLATHLANWKKFGPDPRWEKMKNLPEYADNTSRNTARFLVPTVYSEI